MLDKKEHDKAKQDPQMPVLCPNCFHRLCLELVEERQVGPARVAARGPLDPLKVDPDSIIGRIASDSVKH